MKGRPTLRDRVEQVCWGSLLSALWLGSGAASIALMASTVYAVDGWRLETWRGLVQLFRAGGALPLGLVAWPCLILLATLGGEAMLLNRLSTLIAWLPPLPDLPTPRYRGQAMPAPAVQPTLPSPAPAPPPPPASPSPPPALARMLALHEVWQEPPAGWMVEAMRDELALVPADAWPCLVPCGKAAADLVDSLRRHRLLADHHPAHSVIAQLRDSLSAAAPVADSAPASHPEAALSLGAARLCELLDSFGAAPSPAITPLIESALRGMTEQDWASLDRFPERAGRARVAGDRWREQIRATQKDDRQDLAPATAVLSLLRQFAWQCIEDHASLGVAPMLAGRGPLRLLLHLVDLDAGSWSFPQGPMEPWQRDGATPIPSPLRLLWQRATLLRLRRTPIHAGLLILANGTVPGESGIATMMAARPAIDGLRVSWLSETNRVLPDLQRTLAELSAPEPPSRQPPPPALRAAVQ